MSTSRRSQGRKAMEEIAEVYARSLFEVAKEHDVLDRVHDELGEFTEALDQDRNLQVFLNVLNLFNQETAIEKFSTYQYSGGVVPDEDAFYTGRQTLASQITAQQVAQDPRFLMNSDFQNPLQARIGVKFVF